MSNTKRKKFDLYTLVAIALLTALVFASNYLRIKIPTPLGNTALHLGNVLCLLSGLLLGGLYGGLSAGLGSFFFDLFDPLYIAGSPFTLVFKFMLAFVCGSISHAGGKKGEKLGSNIVGAVLGSLTYVVLYVGKNFLENIWFNRTVVQTALIDAGQRGLVSITNGIIACVVAVPLAFAIRKAIGKTEMYKRVISHE